MRCDRARRLFSACWDDELTLAEKEWLEAHFASCERCRTEYDGLSRALELAGALPRIEASADLVERVLARTRRASTAPDRVAETSTLVAPYEPAREGTALLRWAPVAAAAVLVLVAAIFLVPRLRTGPAGPEGEQRIAAREGVAGAPAGSALEVRQGLVPVTMPVRRTPTGSATAVVPDGVFDHREDIEFVLDPITVKRGQVSVNTEGQKAIITF